LSALSSHASSSASASRTSVASCSSQRTIPSAAVRIGHQQARLAAGEIDQHVRRQRRQRAGAGAGRRGEGHRDHPTRQPPADGRRQAGDRLRRRRRVGRQQVEQTVPETLGLAGEFGPGLGVAGRAGGRELIEVAEDGLAQAGEHAF